jgi:endonuclease YncB( thermonuclease family)
MVQRLNRTGPNRVTDTPMRNPFQILVVLTAVFGLGLGAAFASGVYWGKRDTPSAAASASATPAPAGGGASSGFSGTSGASLPTTGVVESVTGDTITVRTAAGGTVSVKLQGDTQVRQLAAAAPTDIQPGTTVVVQGQPDVDGKLAARSIQIGGAAAPGGASAAQGTRTPGGQRGAATPTPNP